MDAIRVTQYTGLNGNSVEEDWGHPPRPLEICFMGIAELVPVSFFFLKVLQGFQNPLT